MCSHQLCSETRVGTANSVLICTMYLQLLECPRLEVRNLHLFAELTEGPGISVHCHISSVAPNTTVFETVSPSRPYDDHLVDESHFDHW